MKKQIIVENKVLLAVVGEFSDNCTYCNYSVYGIFSGIDKALSCLERTIKEDGDNFELSTDIPWPCYINIGEYDKYYITEITLNKSEVIC